MSKAQEVKDRRDRLAEARRMNIREEADFTLLRTVKEHHGKDTLTLAEALEAQPRSVGIRLAWMRRKGLVSLDVEGNWILSRRGSVLLDTRAETVSQIQELARLTSNDVVLAWVSGREWLRNRDGRRPRATA